VRCASRVADRLWPIGCKVASRRQADEIHPSLLFCIS
jgi:hypothetical protein